MNERIEMPWAPRPRRPATTRRLGASLAGLATLAGLTLTPAPSHAMGEEEYFAEQAARGHLDLDLLTGNGETDACFLYDKRHRAVFCVATVEVRSKTDSKTDSKTGNKTGKADTDTVWVAVFYDGKRDKLTTIPFAKRPKASDDDDDWVARPKAFKKINKRLRKGRWAKRVYAQDFDEGTRTAAPGGYSVATRHDETELAVYKGDAKPPVATYPLQGLSGLYSAEGDLPLIVVDEGPADSKAAKDAIRLRVRLLSRKALKKAAPKTPKRAR